MSDAIVIDTNNIPKHIMDALCRPLVEVIEKSYQCPMFTAGYIEWHKKKYGCLPSNYESLLQGVE